MKKLILVLITGLLVLSLAGCAPGPNPAAGTANAEGEMAGFWRGLWQGIIAPIAFIISLFTPDVSIYEVHNNGGWYDLGFILGLAASLGGGGSRSTTVYRRRRNRHVD
jgi:hypothetical protein